jgi:hypothetical protein
VLGSGSTVGNCGSTITGGRGMQSGTPRGGRVDGPDGRDGERQRHALLVLLL